MAKKSKVGSLACGCTANAHDGAGNPVCGIHDCREVVHAPNLRNRKARCPDCGSLVPSKRTLAFFEYRGPGSPAAREMCICGYTRVAHREEVWARNKLVCHNFEPRGAWDYDSYYCGCRGWD